MITSSTGISFWKQNFTTIQRRATENCKQDRQAQKETQNHGMTESKFPPKAMSQKITLFNYQLKPAQKVDQ